MIGQLTGKVSGCYGTQIILDVSGVGYQVEVSNSVLSRQPRLGSELSLAIYTDVKENSISLYGFGQRLEREVFLLLKKVKGVGSKLAITVLSGLGAEGVLGAIGEGSVDELRRVPGVGKKTAERMIVELREAVVEGVGSGGVSIQQRHRVATGAKPIIPQESNDELSDAMLALEKLGVSSELARRAVTQVAEEHGDSLETGELLRKALSRLK